MIDVSLISIAFSSVMLTYAFMWVFFAISSLFYQPPKTKQKTAGDRSVLVSVVIPANNEEKVIGNLVSDLVNQTYENFEAIVVPHNCTDNTEKVARSLSDPRVKVLPLKTLESGKTYPLNHALRHAKGDIILELDADNRLFSTTYLGNAVRYFEPPVNADAIQSRLRTTNEDTNLLTKLQCLEYEAFAHIYWAGRNALKLGCALGGTGVFFRRTLLEKVGGWDHELTEDYDLFCKLEKEGAKIIYAPNVVSWDEKPSTWSALFRQRKRWVKGHMNVTIKRFREKMNFADFLYLIAPIYNVAWYGANALMAVFFLMPSGLTYWYPPAILWLFCSVSIYSAMSLVLVRLGQKRLLKYLPAYYAFSFHWLPIFLLSFFVKTWGETKTAHGDFLFAETEERIPQYVS